MVQPPQGRVADPDWIRRAPEGGFKMETTIVSHSRATGIVKEVEILNRTIRTTPRDWEYERDQRYAQVPVEQLGLVNSEVASM